MQQDRPPLWLENWRYPSSNRSSVRILANIPAPKRFYETDGDDHGGGAENPAGGDSSAAGANSAAVMSGGDVADNAAHNAADILNSQNALGNSAVIFYLYNIPVTGEKLTYASVIILVTILLITTSVLTISVIVTSETLKDVIGHYILSLAVTDLLCGTLVTPLSVYAALDDEWMFDNGLLILCKAETYVEIMLWTSTAYVFMWIGVDRYIALSRPSRYDVEQSPTRCKCWILFTWIASGLLCCPTLFGDLDQAKYSADTFLCMLDWSAMAPYSITLGILVIIPSVISVVFTYVYIYRSLKNPDNLEDNQKAQLENDPTYAMTFFVILAFIVSWTPYFALRIFETSVNAEYKSRPLQFTLIWLAIGGGSWKVVIYLALSQDFRRSFRHLCRHVCCRCCCNGGRVQDAENGGNSSQYSKLLSSQQQRRFL